MLSVDSALITALSSDGSDDVEWIVGDVRREHPRPRKDTCSARMLKERGPNGIPSHEHDHGRILRRHQVIEPSESLKFEACFTELGARAAQRGDGRWTSRVVAIDGKTIRRCHTTGGPGRPVERSHMGVSAWASARSPQFSVHDQGRRSIFSHYEHAQRFPILADNDSGRVGLRQLTTP